MIELSETARLLLGAYAMADSHTLTAVKVAEMSGGKLQVSVVERALGELNDAGHTETTEGDAYRLTRSGLELTLELQALLTGRSADR